MRYNDLFENDESDNDLFGPTGGSFAGMSAQDVKDRWDELNQELYGYEAYWPEENDPAFLKTEHELKSLMKYARIRFGEDFYQYLSNWREYSDAQYARWNDRTEADPFNNTRYYGEPRITKTGKLHRQDQKTLARNVKDRLGKHTPHVLPEEESDDELFGPGKQNVYIVTAPDDEILGMFDDVREAIAHAKEQIPLYLEDGWGDGEDDFITVYKQRWGNNDSGVPVNQFPITNDSIDENDESDDELFAPSTRARDDFNRTSYQQRIPGMVKMIQGGIQANAGPFAKQVAAALGRDAGVFRRDPEIFDLADDLLTEDVPHLIIDILMNFANDPSAIQAHTQEFDHAVDSLAGEVRAGSELWAYVEEVLGDEEDQDTAYMCAMTIEGELTDLLIKLIQDAYSKASLDESDDQINELKIDNRKGKGAVPYNQDVDYFGLRVKMKPSMFLKLALPLSVSDDDEKTIDHLEQVKDTEGFGAPFLDIHFPKDWFDGDFTSPARVAGHDGRHRMMAILKSEGDDPVEVHLFPRGGIRGREITDNMIKSLKAAMVSQPGAFVRGPIFELEHAHLDEAGNGLIYRGYPCTKDCSGHIAGHMYADYWKITDPDMCPYGNSNSFWEGCRSASED